MTDMINQDRLEQAADWADQLDSLGPEARAELGRWLHEAPENRAALVRMVRLLGDPALFDVVEQARCEAIPPLPPMTEARPARRWPSSRTSGARTCWSTCGTKRFLHWRPTAFNICRF